MSRKPIIPGMKPAVILALYLAAAAPLHGQLSSTTTVNATASWGNIGATASTGWSGYCVDVNNEENLALQVPEASCPYSEGNSSISCDNVGFVYSGTYTIEADFTGFYGQDGSGNTCSVENSTGLTTVTVPQLPVISVVLSSNATTVQAGQTLKLLATVNGYGDPNYEDYYQPPYPDGTAILYYGATALVSQSLTDDPNGGDAFTTFLENTKGISPGKYTVYVNYPGNTNYEPASSDTLSVTVEAAQMATSTGLTVTPNPTVKGQPTTLAVTVTPTGTTTPTGSVTILAGGASLGTIALTNGKASLTVPADLAVGTYQIQALYSGDTYNIASTSPAVELTVVAQTSTTTAVAVSPSTIVAGATAQLTATVTPAISNVVPTGTVTVTANGTPITTLTLNKGTASETVSTAGLPSGTYSVVGKYNGSTLATASTSPTETVTIAPASSVSVVASPNPVAQGSITTLTATVKNGSGGAVTSGTVAFSYSGNALGSANVTSSGTATLPIETTSFAKGTYTLNATFSGSGSVPAATGTVSLTVN